MMPDKRPQKCMAVHIQTACKLTVILKERALVGSTWNKASFMLHALHYLWHVLLMASLSQAEHDLHQVSVHQTGV